MSLADAQPLDLNRSKPVNMPITKANAVLIESSSASSSEQSLLDIYRKNCEEMGAAGEHQVIILNAAIFISWNSWWIFLSFQIREDLADAMIESPGAREAGKSFICSFILANRFHNVFNVELKFNYFYCEAYLFWNLFLAFLHLK